MDYESMTMAEMKNFARENGLRGYSRLRRNELITLLQNNYQPTPILLPRPQL